jgi:hypothetical protein
MSKPLFTIKTASQLEKMRATRGAPVPPSKPMRDKRNDYQRKPKHFKGW